MQRNLLALLAGAASIMMAVPANAATTITTTNGTMITPGAGTVQPDENVLATTDMTAQTVIGFTNNTHTSVSVQSLNEEILSTTDSNGQAKFTTADGSLDTAKIFLTNGGTFTSAEFNLFNALASTTSVLISVNGGTAISFDLGSGSNFFDFVAGAIPISSISFDTNGVGVVDLRQVRLGGIQAPRVGAVPEPATWALMLLGFGGMGAAMRRSRRRTTAQLRQIA